MHRLWLFLLAAGMTQAQTPATDIAAPAAIPAPGITREQPAQDSPVHDELRALQAATEKALNEHDLEGLLSNVDDTVVFTAMNAEAGYGKEGIRRYFDRMLNGPDKVVEKISVDFIPDQLAVFYGPDVAVSAGKADSHYELTNGLKFDVAARYTVSMVRRDGKWLVSSAHYSTNMFRNPVLDAQRRVAWAVGGGAVLLIGLLAFFLGRRSGRNRSG